ncbi:MAG: FAD-binding protein, partial [Patescibacteria group bacterium]|nr:FAD-binding protein [Patescibacteria group bacterium]
MKNKVSQELKKLLPRVQFEVLLKNHTTFKIGGKAKYFFGAKTKKDLIKAIKTAEKLKIPFYILGGGSKLLISDQGVNFLIIKVQNSGIKVLNTRIYVEAGLSLEKLTRVALNNSLTGLEWASGIPGTVGGAVRGNAGAFVGSMKDVITEVEAFNIGKKEVIVFKNKDCKFFYRNSIFKRDPNLIILSCKLQLEKGNKK